MPTLADRPLAANPFVTVSPGLVCVMTLDAARRITHANADMRRALGFGAKACADRPLRSCCHPDMPPQVLRDVWVMLDDGLVWSAPLKWLRADGAGLWMRTVFAPMQRGASEGCSMVVGLAVSVSQVQAAERVYGAMRRHRAERESAFAGGER